MTEAQKFGTDLLATEFANAAMRIFASITPEARKVMHRLDEVTAAMKAESRQQVDNMLAEAKEAPWIASQIWMVAVMEVAQAGKRKVLEIIEEEKK